MEPGHRHQDLAPLVEVGTLLVHHLLDDVPGEQQQHVGSASRDLRGCQHRDAGPGQVAALLVLVAVDDEVHQLVVHAAGAEQGRALGGSAVRGDHLAGPLAAGQLGVQLLLDLRDPGAEALVGLEPVQATLALGGQVLQDGRGRLPRQRQVPPERPAVQVWEVLHVDQGQAVPCSQLLHGQAGEVAVVLVVDRVEGAPVEQRTHGRVLHRDQAPDRHHRGQSPHEVVEVRDVRHDVVGDDDVGSAVLCDKAVGQVEAEELLDGPDASSLRGGSRPAGRLDADHGDLPLDQVRQEVAVIAGDLDDQGPQTEVTLAHQGLHVPAGVRDQRLGVGRVVRVVVVEQGVGGQGPGQLHQCAPGAEADAERVPLLLDARVGGQPVGDRQLAEVEKRHRRRPATGSARRRPVPAAHHAPQRRAGWVATLMKETKCCEPPALVVASQGVRRRSPNARLPAADRRSGE